MLVKELIARLSALNPEAEIMILDGENGGGVPRTVNLGPRVQVVEQGDEDETGDCDGMAGEEVVCIGHGLY